MTTANRILDAAEDLIQDRGYFGLSFADIAQRVGIKKASIYYHFPAKADLGKAVVTRYRERMSQSREALQANEKSDAWEALSSYLEPIIRLAQTPSSACLCGVLGGEFMALPDEMKSEVSAFFGDHIAVLTNILSVGLATGEFKFATSPAVMAKIAFSVVEGSMLIKRTQNDLMFFDEVLDGLLVVLGRKESQ